MIPDTKHTANWTAPLEDSVILSSICTNTGTWSSSPWEGYLKIKWEGQMGALNFSEECAKVFHY